MSNGQHLKAALQRAQLTVTDIARFAGRSRPTVYSWFSAEELPPEAEDILALVRSGIEAGRLPMRNKCSPSERPKMAAFALMPR